jgi:hypothetical protein
MIKILNTFVVILALLQVQSCTSLNTFPGIARAGDTVSLMVGSSVQARKDTISVTFTDSAGGVWDLSALGLVRSVFNLRPDGRAKGLHYAGYYDTFIPWALGHEPLQTVLVTDLPQLNVTPGPATLSISLNTTDNTSGAADPFTVAIEVIAGTGSQELFATDRPGGGSLDFTNLEPTSYAKVDFKSAPSNIGAVSLVIDFDEAVLNPNEINIYSPESTVRGSTPTSNVFGETQRMIYWRHDGQQLFVNIVAPQGIEPRYLRFFALHPDTVTGNPAFSLIQSSVYDVNGDTLSFVPTLEYVQ